MDSAAEISSDYEPDEVYEIDTIEKLRIIANPLRMQILDCLIPEARTAKEVGDLLDIQSNTRYYHISELEQAGMIRVVDTVINSGIQQKYYRATGKYYRLEPALLHNGDQLGSPDSAATFLSGALEVSAGQLRRSFKEGLMDREPDITRVSRRVIRTDPERIIAFSEKVRELEREFEGLHQEGAGDHYEFSYALFPSVTPGGRSRE